MTERAAWEREWKKQLREDNAWRRRALGRSPSLLDRQLEQRIPEGLRETLQKAFASAFGVVFRHGVGAIEHSYRRREVDARREEAELELLLHGDRAALRRFARQAEAEARKNTGISAVKGVGLGLLGIGLPDIPLFVAMLLRGIYKVARSYGYPVEGETERRFILLLLLAALSSGEEFAGRNAVLDRFLDGGPLPEQESRTLMAEAADALAGELLCIKFLQGLPLVGAVGGLWDSAVQQRTLRYAVLKYNRRFLQDHRPE